MARLTSDEGHRTAVTDGVKITDAPRAEGTPAATQNDDSVSVTTVPVDSRGTVTVLRTENHRLSEILERMLSSLGGEGHLARIAETNKETLARLVDLVEQFAADRKHLAPAALADPAQLARVAAPVPVGPTLENSRTIAPPALLRIFEACYKQAQQRGLVFPAHFALSFRDAPPGRDCDGRTTRQANGGLSMLINANAEKLIETIFHELKHASDFHAHGTRYARDELERRAAAFVQSMKAPAPKPEPVSLGAGYSAGNRRRWYP